MTLIDELSQGNKEMLDQVILEGVSHPSSGQGNRSTKSITDELIEAGHQEVSRVAVKIPTLWRNNDQRPSTLQIKFRTIYCCYGYIAFPSRFNLFYG